VFGKKIPEAGARISSVKGEAVAVDLGERRGVVFALIEHGSYGELYSAFGVEKASNTTENFNQLKTGVKVPLPKENWPVFVTFTDMNDPKSIKYVNSIDVLSDDYIEQIIGKDVNVKNITVEITDEPMTWGTIDKYLPNEANAIFLGRRSFKQGEDK